MTDVIPNLFVDVHPSKGKLTLFLDGSCFLIASTGSGYSLQQVLLRVLADSNTRLLCNALYDHCNLRLDIVTGGVGRRWYGCCRTELEVRIEGQESEYLSKSCYCLLYKRTSKERRKGNPPTLSALSLYTIHLPPSNHSSCSDVPSESHPMILHTTPLFLIVTTTPPLLTSQHLSSLLYLY